MNVSKLTLGLAAIGVVSLASVAQAEEKLSSVMTAVSGTTIGGWVDTSLNWRPGTDRGPGSTAFRGNDGVAAQDGFNLNVVGINLDKALDADQQWSAGYHVQLAAGPDAVTYRTTTGAAVGASAVALSEAYVTLRAPLGNGLDFKLGRFASPVGYEVFESYKNPHYGRSFGFNLEPTVHEGVLASYTFSKEVSVSAGVANTMDNSSQGKAVGANGIVESKKTYIFGTTLTAPESLGFLKDSTLSAVYCVGNVAGTAATMQHLYVGAVVATPVAGLNFGAAFDYQETSTVGPGTPAVGSAIALYGSYAASEKLKLNLRGELAHGDQFGIVKPSGKNGDLYSVTATADYALWNRKNVITRAEVRWDNASGSPYGSPAADEKNLLTFALNVIYMF